MDEKVRQEAVALDTEGKRLAVLAYLGTQGERLLYPENTDSHTQAKLAAWFADGLVEIMTNHYDTRRNPATEWISEGLQVMLHTGDVDPAIGRMELRQGMRPLLHLYTGAKDDVEAQLGYAHVKAKKEADSPSTPKGAKSEYYAQSSRVRGNRSLYDLTADTLPQERIGNRRAPRNTSRDLRIYGQMRMGDRDFSKEEIAKFSRDFENARNISQDKYEHILEGHGGRWLWEQLHDYLLDEETLKAKHPKRWFGDMCVLCGISDPMLEEWTGTAKSIWKDMKDVESPYQKIEHAAFQENVSKALSLFPSESNLAGRELWSADKYIIPAGSVFGLSTIHHPNRHGGGGVDPEAVEHMLRTLLKKDYRDKASHKQDSIHILKRLRHISDAYIAGAFSQPTLVERNIARNALRQIHQWYAREERVGVNGYRDLGKYGKTTDGIVTWLQALDQKHWHLQNLSEYTDAFQRLPVNAHLVTKGLEPEDAFEFAQQHHKGTIGSFLQTYRMAQGKTIEDLRIITGIIPPVLSTYERHYKLCENAVRDRALSRYYRNKKALRSN